MRFQSGYRRDFIHIGEKTSITTIQLNTKQFQGWIGGARVLLNLERKNIYSLIRIRYID